MTDSCKKQTTASGREIKSTGMTSSKKSAIQKLREAREGKIKRTDQYEVSRFFTGKSKIASIF